MTIPFVKALITGVRLTLRPFNSSLTRMCKARGKTSSSYKFFVAFGQSSNRFEVRMNKLATGV